MKLRTYEENQICLIEGTITRLKQILDTFEVEGKKDSTGYKIFTGLLKYKTNELEGRKNGKKKDRS
jgi:hypothetical protein